MERVEIHLKPSRSPRPAVMGILLETLVQVLHVLGLLTKYCNVAMVDSDSRLKKATQVFSRRTSTFDET